MSNDTHICPRRAESPVNWPTPDTWRVLPNGDRTCSFCGSLHPEDFLRLVTDATQEGSTTDISPSTKSYKVYVRQEGVPNAAVGGIKFYTQHLHDWDKCGDDINKVYLTALRVSRDRHVKRLDEMMPGSPKQ